MDWNEGTKFMYLSQTHLGKGFDDVDDDDDMSCLIQIEPTELDLDVIVVDAQLGILALAINLKVL